jgi:hypothetical protein
MPIGRVYPSVHLWTHARRTGEARYVPDFAPLTRLCRFSSRCCSHCSAVCSSTPDDPSLRVRGYASRIHSASASYALAFRCCLAPAQRRRPPNVADFEVGLSAPPHCVQLRASADDPASYATRICNLRVRQASIGARSARGKLLVLSMLQSQAETGEMRRQQTRVV